MNFPDYFADADSNFKEAKYVIFGVPFGKTSSFRFGSNLAPKEIRQASWNFETYDLRSKTDIVNIKIHDYGDLPVDNLNSLKNITNLSKKILDENKFPIAIGGEHSITPFIIKSLPKDISIISLDAHMDFRKIYENNVNSHACVLRRISEVTKIQNIALLGVRSVEKEEFDDANRLGLFYRDVFTIKKKGILDILKETKKHIGDNRIYLTFDIDVIDPAFAPGTSTPEPFGLTTFEVLEIFDFFSKQIIGFDVVEVCPKYDHGQTALLAAKFIRYLIGVTNDNKL